MKQSITTVKIGNHLSDKFADASAPGCRTYEQWKAIIDFHANTMPSLCWMLDPFSFDGKKYKCAFWHTFVNDKGLLTVIDVSKGGKITKVTVAKGEPCEELPLMLEKFGLFMGA